MAQVRNEDRFGGEFMVQDTNHMSGNNPASDTANKGKSRQAQQSQPATRQQGSLDNDAANQQGSERRQSR